MSDEAASAIARMVPMNEALRASSFEVLSSGMRAQRINAYAAALKIVTDAGHAAIAEQRGLLFAGWRQRQRRRDAEARAALAIKIAEQIGALMKAEADAA